MKASLPLVGITMGDPVGVGPEIIPKALADPRVWRCCRPVIYGNATRLMSGAVRVGHDGILVINPAAMDTERLEWGKPTPISGMAMAAYLQAAIDDAIAGRIAAIVTGPIHKLALKMADIHYSGHTEILAQRTGTQNYAMMLAGKWLKVVLATIHIPIEHGIHKPRIAVLGLNPHAGESGLFGSEEQTIISPAISLAASQGIAVTGPHPPDTVFFTASRGAHDAVVAMYHDQGLGPFKMIHFDDGVNTTLGLPIIRTSVDHGTAYDIAGTGQASSTSMVAAITMAADQARWQNHQFNP